MSSGCPVLALACGRSYRLQRRNLPGDHPALGRGAVGDVLVLTEDDELVEIWQLING
jgi:hypothetical protein